MGETWIFKCLSRCLWQIENMGRHNAVDIGIGAGPYRRVSGLPVSAALDIPAADYGFPSDPVA